MSVLSDLLLQFIFPVVDSDGVIMSVKSMNQRLKHRCVFIHVSPHIIITDLLRSTGTHLLGIIQTSYLNWRLVQMSQVGCGLSRFMTQHHHVGIDQSERINNNLKDRGWFKRLAVHLVWHELRVKHLYLSFDALNGIHHDSNSTFWERLKALLCVDVHTRQPAAKSRVTVVPSYHHLWPKQQHLLYWFNSIQFGVVIVIQIWWQYFIVKCR